MAGGTARAAVRLLLVAFLIFIALAGMPRIAAAVPAPSYADRRVTAIPARDLLTRAPADLVDPRRQESAHRLRLRTRPLYAFWALSQIVALILLWRRGTAARLRDRLTGLGSVHAIRFAFGFLLTCIVALVALPTAFVIFRLGIGFDILNGRISEWLRDAAVSALLEGVAAGAFVVAVFWLVDRSRQWWIYMTVATVLASLSFTALEPIAVAPLFERIEPLAASDPAAPRLAALAKAAGLAQPHLVVADLSRRSRVARVYAAGFGPTSRIVIGDTQLAFATREETGFVAAREFVHAAQGDVWRTALFRTVFFVLCAALAVFISDRVGFRRDDDPLVHLVLSFGLLGAIVLLASPVMHSYSRGIEARTDREALALTGDSAAAVRSLVRFADEELAPVCPSRIVRLYYYDREPVGSRIAALTGRPDPCP